MTMTPADMDPAQTVKITLPWLKLQDIEPAMLKLREELDELTEWQPDAYTHFVSWRPMVDWNFRIVTVRVFFDDPKHFLMALLKYR